MTNDNIRGLKKLLSIILTAAVSAGTCTAQNRAYVDVHMHLDGVGTELSAQESGAKPGRGLPKNTNRQNKRVMPSRMKAQMSNSDSSKSYLPAAKLLVQKMDKYGVEQAIVMPPPQKPNQKGGYSYEELLPVIEAYKGRIILGAGGGQLNPMIVGTDPENVTPKIKAEFQKKAQRIINAGAKVFGEMTAMHFGLNPKHHYIAPAPDHPLFLLLADIAAKNNMPIDLHMEAIHNPIDCSSKLSKACNENPNSFPATLPAFERLLMHNRKAKIVWQHIGWDNTGEMTTDLVKTLMLKHSNLYIAIKGVPVEKGARENRIHDDGHRVLPQWLSLFQEFPTRIVVGADEFINAGGGYKKPPFFKETWSTISTFPPELARQIGGENAKRIYNL